MPKITDELKKQILDKATLHNVLQEYHGFHKKKGASYVMPCPKCGKEDKLEYNEAKQIANCFSCDLGGVKTPVSYLMKYQDMSYPQALEELARIEHISLLQVEFPGNTRDYYCQHCDKKTSQFKQTKISEKEGEFDWFCKICNKPTAAQSAKFNAKKKRQANHQVPFLQIMIAGSGLTTEDITGPVYVNEDTRKDVAAYESATVDSAFNIIPGDDVVIHYYDLDGRPMTYYKKDRKGNATGKPQPFYRVRYQNPELHTDKKGRAMKYQSPWGSGSKIYINKWIREKYKKSSKIETLYVQEGEKKADKATKHGMISVGIMGIHNIAYNQRLPKEFEAIIKRCQVENVVFVLDEDWNRLSSTIDSEHSADQRPKSFFRAVVNFQKHFQAFTNNDIFLNIYFGYVRNNPEKDKGIDDLLVNSLRDKEDNLKSICKKALNKPDGETEWLQFHDITTMPQFKIQDFWHLNTVDSFTEHYKKDLKDLKKFRFGKVEYRFNKEGKRELAQPLLPDEIFWETIVKKNDSGEVVSKRYKFDYDHSYNFMRNRGFYKLSLGHGQFHWIQITGNVVKKVEPHEIKDFVVDFTRQTLNDKPLRNMLFQGSQMYLGPQSLGHMFFTELHLHQPSKNMQYLYFKKNYFKVTDEGIFLEDIKNLDGQVWQDNILDFEPTLTEPLISEVHKITKADARENEQLQKHVGEYTLDFSEAGLKCDFLQFLWNTSVYFDRKKPFADATLDEKFETTRHMLSKLTAFGYLLHRFRESDNQKAVVAMDGTMSEVGKSNGRSGKSLLGVALEQLVPTVTIPGKRKDLMEDKFLFEEVDQRTGAIFFDDVRPNLDIEFLFPYITGKFTLEKKGLGKMTLPPEFVQKFYITTNHALRGEGGSFEDRQFLIGYSNWYNKNHKPKDDFGTMFFDEWDTKQWNLFYNMAATCLHLYFKHGLVPAPSEKLLNRKMRQEMGEQFLDWAEEYFSNPDNVNQRIYKDTVYQCSRADADHIKHGDGFVTKYPSHRRWTSPQVFKSKLKLYCKFKKYEFNKEKEGNDIKSNGREYIVIDVPEEVYEELLMNRPKADELPI